MGTHPNRIVCRYPRYDRGSVITSERAKAEKRAAIARALYKAGYLPKHSKSASGFRWIVWEA